MIMISMWGVLTRKKKYSAAIGEGTQLARVLSTADLTALGVGSTLGVGVYVIAGQVAREIAGPAVIVSFLIAAVASILSGLCYAEFGARIPRAGSAYVYSYVTVGELVAFIIGWNLILEYVIGAASVAKGISLYIDSLAADVLKDAFKEVAPIHVPVMADYFDFFAFGLAVLVSAGLAFGLKDSTRINNLATVVNVCVVLFIIIAGATQSNVENWRRPANETVKETGAGGFLPFGVTGMLQGAATCFYAFVGFDCIATTGEEVKNPKRAIPFAIIGSQIVIFVSYFCSSTVLTLMIPFYEQDVNAPFPHAFEEVGLEGAKWIVAIGGICGLFTSLFGSLLPLPRILYALASDGLIFKFLGKVNPRFSTPMVGTLIAGFITGLMAALFDLSQLVNMMSIGTLLAYTLVSMCVLILRYRDAYFYDDDRSRSTPITNKRPPSVTNGVSAGFGHVFNTNRHKEPTRVSQKLSLTYILIYSALAFVMARVLFLLNNRLADYTYIIILISVIAGLMILFLILLSFQPTSGEALSFRVPFVPVVPAFSILINIYLMLMLDVPTWIRFGIWMFIGIPIYIFCVRNSCKQTPSTRHLPPLTPPPTRNGHANLTFVVDEDSTCPSEEKPPSEDSGIARSMENIRAHELYDEDKKKPEDARTKDEERVVRSRDSLTSIEAALATLDDAIPYDDDCNNLRDMEDGLRKLSSVSDASSARLVKEDVVALVHREDIRSVPTTPSVEVTSVSPLAGAVRKDADEEESRIEEEEETSVSSENDDEILISHHRNHSQVQSPRPSLILSDDVGGEETDTDALQMEVFSIPPAPPISAFEEYKSPRIPRVRLSQEEEKPADSTPPPPPPMEGFETYKPSMAIPKAKLSAPPTPLPDYSREPSNSVEEEEEKEETPEDNVKFGDKQHQTLKDKLNKMLMGQATAQVPLTKPKDYPVDDEAVDESKTYKPMMSRIISEMSRANAKDNEAEEERKGDEEKLVDDSPQAPGDIRNRLNAILKSTRVDPMNMSPSKPRKSLASTFAAFKDDDGAKDDDGVKDMEDHRLKMLGALSSIRLQNVQRNT